MDKTAIKSYAVTARKKLIEAVKLKAASLEITQNTMMSMFDFDKHLEDKGIFLSKKDRESRIELMWVIMGAKKDLGETEGFNHVMENIACTWFNRFVALRIMEVNDWLPSEVRVLSSVEPGRIEPEVLRHCENLDYVDPRKIAVLRASEERNAPELLYKYILTAQCNALSAILPGIFQRENDYTELLMPDALLVKDGIVRDFIEAIHEDNFNVGKQGQIEIIGWLYQSYISEKKDEVFAALKKNVKINKDTIPAATQLFTPEWIVKYMVENSVGRLWLESNPNDDLRKKWQYYVDEAEQEPEVAERLRVLRSENPVKSPEDIKLIDPCMGSGHVLVYAFDVLYQIYESAGYSQRDIPNLILRHNLHGLDIDERACQLAYFALMIKARSYSRRFFRQENVPQPMIYSAKNDSELMEFGSLLKIDELGEKPELTGQITFDDLNYERKLNAWNYRRLLAQKYDVVVTNPPYMSPTPPQMEWIKKNYPDSKSDLCVVFIERNFDLLKKSGYLSMITMHSWMFLSSYEKFRAKLIGAKDIVNMAHLGARAFEEIGGEVVQTTAFTARQSNVENYLATYARLVDFGSQQAKENAFLAGENRYAVKNNSFGKIPGTPIAYWVSGAFINVFEYEYLSSFCKPMAGICTGNNDKYFRSWYEVNIELISIDYISRADVLRQNKHYWFFIYKGGDFRRWYGNNELIINYSNKSIEDMNGNLGFRHDNREFYFIQGITWSKLCSGRFSARYMNKGSMFDSTGTSAFPNADNYNFILGLLNSNFAYKCFEILNPTLAIYPNNVGNIPLKISEKNKSQIDELVQENIALSRADWDSFETSWDFQRHPLLKSVNTGDTIQNKFAAWEQKCNERFAALKLNEEELNRIFIEIYGLQDELTPEVDDKDVTVRKADLSREIRSFISYAVGCMFGRYSLDEPGIVFAGGKFDRSRYTKFKPVEYNIIPINHIDYFDNDIVLLFCEFVGAAYGESTLDANLDYIANVLYPDSDGSTRDKIRRYFLNDFYKDHVKIYQKRPIYWQFDSGKKDAFKGLFYLHRYDKYTVGLARGEYMHPLQASYRAEVKRLEEFYGETNDNAEKADCRKKIKFLQDKIEEYSIYDQIVSHFALHQIGLDLDDGVRVNYAKFQGVEVPKSDGKIEVMDLLGRI